MVVLLKNLTESDVEQQALVKKVQELVGSTTLEALTAFIGSQGQQELLWNVVVQFINDNITISRLYKIK